MKTPKFLLPICVWYLLSGIPLSRPLHSFLSLVATIVTCTSMKLSVSALFHLTLFTTVPSKLLQMTEFHYFVWQNIFVFVAYTFATRCFNFYSILWMLISHQMDRLRILPATLSSLFYLCSSFFMDMIPFIYFCFCFLRFVSLIKHNYFLLSILITRNNVSPWIQFEVSLLSH